ncbi:hypothetical protein [Candidatus Poriferisodalis sp.]|uniref:hypothetical protein n=1 Tax=Candidatus Poriferisodalis sp. TaxID=3101277 RepID=UPI003B0251F4
MPKMDFKRDLGCEIVRYFDERSISFEREQSSDTPWLLERYFRLRLKEIAPRPRRVHHSTELRAKLGAVEERYRLPFTEIEQRFEIGSDVSEFQSRLASNVSVPDAMLNDLGLHHLHLGAKRSPDAKRVERSDMLLLVMVCPDDAYFVDIRPHPQSSDPDDYGWSQQEYLRLIDRNWSHLLDPYELRGVTGSSIPDSGRRALQQKNANVATQIGDRAIAPPGGGMTSSGANLTHVWMAMKVLWQLEQLEGAIHADWEGQHQTFQRAGLDAGLDTELHLVPIKGATLPEILVGPFTGGLLLSGWTIQIADTGTRLEWGLQWA